MTLYKNLIVCLMIFSLTSPSIANMKGCDELLTECATVVEVQQDAIQHHLKLIEKKDEIQKEMEKENKRLEDEEDKRTKQLIWSNVAWLLLLLL